jgi:hypothetical protein
MKKPCNSGAFFIWMMDYGWIMGYGIWVMDYELWKYLYS